MALEMKIRCQRCGDQLTPQGEAYICSYECTYCGKCAADSNSVCLDCGGELNRRPRRTLRTIAGSRPRANFFKAQRWWLIWIVSLVVWLFITLFATITVLQLYRAQGGHMDFRESAYMQLSQMMPFFLLTPLVFALVARLPIRRDNWILYSVLYLIGGVVFTLGHVALRGITPYGVWDRKTHVWHSAVWDYQAHKFNVQWGVFKELFAASIYDDTVSTYVPIVFVAYVVGYYSTLKDRERVTQQLETQLTKANLQMLKSQLQPHFLFNTMHSISSLMFSDAHAADRMMSRLSELLRMSLEEGTEQITTLNRELEFVNGYVEIEQMRLGERLTVQLDISPATLDAEFPHLLLQPLVENAIQHGVSRITCKGEIRISSRRDERSLWLTISDNGPGYDCPNGTAPKLGLGIRTSRERLQTLYGDAYLLEFRTPQNGGTEVTIRIPFRPTINSTNHKE